MSKSACIHYNRLCQILTPCCGKFYACRICHDLWENHVAAKCVIKILKCCSCNNVQSAKNKCDNCGTVFASYWCSTCSLWDDNTKRYFHCDECNLCKIGGRENYFHCRVCYVCLAIRLQDNHTCMVNCGLGYCTLCLNAVRDSPMPVHLPQCGHILHEKCFYIQVSNNVPACILCNSWLD